MEFLQLYELSIEAANRDEKVMANWFSMVLKDGARTWLLNQHPGTMSSWDEMRTRFIANFQGTRKHPLTVGDLCRIKQQTERPCRSTSSASTTLASRFPR